MAEFQTPVDVANRALQHCGASRIDPTLGFTEISKNASETQFAYGKLRQVEMSRTTWTFATRKVPLRPIDNNTMKLNPALWSQTATYFVGSIVADQFGTLWISNSPNNTGNQPQSTAQWVPYYGPLTVSLYDSTQQYFAGEIVYTMAGAGLINAYLSRQNNNVIHPALPDLWVAQTVYQVNQVVQVFPAWASGTTYSQGQTVTYTDGFTYTSLTNGNVGNIPPSSGANWILTPTLALTTAQPNNPTPAAIPNTSPVIEWSQVTTYSIGAFVMFNGTEYVSIANNNTGNFPNAAGSSSWIALTLGTLYMSLISFNIGNNPANAPALWASGTTYATGNKVGGSDGVIYSSVGSGNIGHDPTTDGGTNWTNTGVLNPWTTVFTQGGGNDMWLQIGGASFPSGVALSLINMIYPVGAGPAGDIKTLNVFLLPAGYLRSAPQAENNSGVTWLGGPSGVGFDDFQYEGELFTSWMTKPLIFRFIADIQDVTKMSAQFCEGLALRIALEVCQTVTQSEAKLAVIAKKYDKFMSEARIIDGINADAATVPDDPLITVRY